MGPQPVTCGSDVPGPPQHIDGCTPPPLACLAASNDLDFPREFPTEPALALHPPEPEVPGPPGNSYENVNHIRIPRSKKPPRPTQAESRGPLQPHPGLVTWLGPHPQPDHQPWWQSPPITIHDADRALADSGHAQFIWVGSPGSLCARSGIPSGSPTIYHHHFPSRDRGPFLTGQQALSPSPPHPKKRGSPGGRRIVSVTFSLPQTHCDFCFLL